MDEKYCLITATLLEDGNVREVLLIKMTENTKELIDLIITQTPSGWKFNFDYTNSFKSCTTLKKWFDHIKTPCVISDGIILDGNDKETFAYVILDDLELYKGEKTFLSIMKPYLK